MTNGIQPLKMQDDMQESTPIKEIRFLWNRTGTA